MVETKTVNQIIKVILSHTNNYLPLYTSDHDNLSSSTSSSRHILQLCQVSSVLVYPIRRSCAYKKHDIITEMFFML